MRSLASHPLQHLLLPLPLATWLSSLACDVLYLMDGNSAFAAGAYFLMLAGLLGSLLAAPFAWAAFAVLPAGSLAKRRASLRSSLNLFALLLFVLSFFSRHGLEGGVPDAITQGQMVLSAFAISCLAISGYVAGAVRPGTASPVERQELPPAA